MNRVLALVLTAILAVPAAAAPASKTKSKKTQTPAGSALSGKILGSNGKPVRDALVVVHSLDGDSSWTSGPSDKGGRFSVGGIHYGWGEITVKTADGAFLGDQAMNFPPGKKVDVTFSLIETRDKPASWWADRSVEPPTVETTAEIAGMVQSSQKLTGVEYWKSPAGIAIIVGVTVLALGVIAAGGRYKQPAGAN